jgi:hypothetical protein
MPVSKNISIDKTYIDYTQGNSGVRVWEDRCAAITRKDSESEWSECGEARSMPVVVHEFQDMPDRARLITNRTDFPLTDRIDELGSDELKSLTKGEKSFALAISTQ